MKQRLSLSRQDSLHQLKKEYARDNGLSSLPTDQDFLQLIDDDSRFRSSFKIKPVRSASGIVVISVVTAPHSCPHGTCIYCPGGPTIGTPQSYLGQEPAVSQGIRNGYVAAKQVTERLTALASGGHSIEKAELIILGGTFLNYPRHYQEEFVKGCYDGLNGFESPSLEQAKSYNVNASVRSVGLTIETRPDFCKDEHVDQMLNYGATRVEIGVQALDERIYLRVNRGHTMKDVTEAFQISRDAGFKIAAHMMPGLPGSSPSKDLEDFRRLFGDEQFKPDMLKIYPTLVVPGTALERLYKLGKYSPYSLEDTVNLLVEVKRLVPPWVRIMRIQREISAEEITSGVKAGNLRELVLKAMSQRGYSCNCMRCKEIGLRSNTTNTGLIKSNLKLSRTSYPASNGTEYFLSFEEPKNSALVGFLRLRIPSNRAHRPEIKSARTSVIRELHVYGSALAFGDRDRNAWQHKGLGKALVAEAEKLAAEEFEATKMIVISAVGTRKYYSKLGYQLDGPYMSKALKR